MFAWKGCKLGVEFIKDCCDHGSILWGGTISATSNFVVCDIEINQSHCKWNAWAEIHQGILFYQSFSLRTVTIWIPNTWILFIKYSYHLNTEHLNTEQYRCPVFKLSCDLADHTQAFSVRFSDHHLNTGHKSTIWIPD